MPNRPTVRALNDDFTDMLDALVDARAEFIVVGAHAMAAHGYPRATGDIDLLVRPTSENAARVLAALTGVTFDEAWESRVEAKLADRSVAILGRAALIRNERATGRDKDLLDAAWLEKSG
ncbi:MAG TPA: hypothetical protein VJR89_34655 [Polyangiales bacterium]|nr:hypothetical protein [Polyangiales bacterium]